MNRREFLRLVGMGALGVAGVTLPHRARAWEPASDGDWEYELHLPVIGATKPRPTPWITLTPTPEPTPEPTATPTPSYEPLTKGAVIIRATSDVATLAASWWYSYTLGPTQYLNDQHVPMLRDPGIYHEGEWRDLPQGANVLFYNEPNCVDQMHGVVLSPYDVARHLHAVHEQRPDLRIVGPALFTAWDACDWYDHHLLEAYHDLYGVGSWPCVANAIHSIQGTTAWHVDRIRWVMDIYDQHGYGEMPVWVTEYMGGPWWDYEPQETIAAGVWEWMLTEPRIERACWFPARWAASWTDPGGVGWLDQRLIDDAGELTSVGSVYAGLGG
jgi:hypothetical protein